MNEFERMRRAAETNKRLYPPGTRIQLLCMNDPYAPVEPLTTGTVIDVDDAGSLLMKWDNGRTLSVIPGEDAFRKIAQEAAQSAADLSENEAEEPVEESTTMNM